MKAAGEEALTAGGSDSGSDAGTAAVADTENNSETETEPDTTSASESNSDSETDGVSGDGSASADSSQDGTIAGEEEDPATEESSTAPVNASTNSKAWTSSPKKTDKVSDAQTLKSEPAVND